MSLLPPQFAPHGSSRFEVRGPVLVLHSQGPFNAEHVQAVGPGLREHAARLQPLGPWASINVISKSVMVTPDALEMLRKSAQWSYEQLGRVACAYVVAADVEGRALMLPRLRWSAEGIMPVEVFLAFDEAERWCHQRLREASASRANPG